MKKYHHFSITTPILVMLAFLAWIVVITGNIAGIPLMVLSPIVGVVFTVLSCIVVYYVDNEYGE